MLHYCHADLTHFLRFSFQLVYRALEDPQILTIQASHAYAYRVASK